MNISPAPPPTRRWRGLLLRWAVTLGLLGFLATRLDLRELGALLREVRWPFLLLAMAATLGDRIVATWRWWALLRVKGVRPGFLDLTWLHLAAGFMGSFLPTSFSADAVRILMLARREGRALEITAASVMDRLLMILGTFLLAAATAALLARRLPVPGAGWLFPALALLAVAGLVLAFQPRIWRPLARLAHWLPGRTLADRLAKFYWAMHAYLGHPRALAGAGVLTAAMLALRVLVILSLGRAIGAAPGFVDYAQVMPLAWVVVMLPVSVGGLGLQEGAYAAWMTLIGLSPAEAVSISLLDHVVTRAVSLLGAAAWAGRRP